MMMNVVVVMMVFVVFVVFLRVNAKTESVVVFRKVNVAVYAMVMAVGRWWEREEVRKEGDAKVRREGDVKGSEGGKEECVKGNEDVSEGGVKGREGVLVRMDEEGEGSQHDRLSPFAFAVFLLDCFLLSREHVFALLQLL
jgi:hypothetical protein